MKSIKGKNILFLAPSFFGYESKIEEKLKELGANVDFYNERSINSSYAKALIKITPKIFTFHTIKYYSDIINHNKNKKYDYIFVIKCEMLSAGILRKLKKIYPNAITCLYLWDSIKNVKGLTPKLKEFDRILTFDSNDAEEYNLQFRPLFYLDCYKKEISERNYKYDICFIGTIHSDRLKIINYIRNYAGDSSSKWYLYFYLQNKLMYYIYKLFKKEFKNSMISDFSFQKLSSLKIAEIIDKSKIILDIQHPNQTGLTIRTIEMMGMNKKLITTNRSIMKYDFYKPNNIMIIDRIKPNINNNFFSTEYEVIAPDIYYNYSIEKWIEDIFFASNEK